ncbi:MAG: LpxI family protein [Bdellovibrionales bacterium]
MTQANIERLGIIAGAGSLPEQLARQCEHSNIEPFIVCFDGQTDPALCDGRDHVRARLGQIGKIIKALKRHKIEDLVMIGGIGRPSYSELIPDLKATKFLASTGFKALGDNDLLSALKDFLGNEGFELHAIQDFMPNLLAPDSVMTKTQPSPDDWIDIRRGVEILQSMAPLDIGQALIVQEGLVLGIEAIEGTNVLIKRCSDYKRGGRKGVLVKLCKAQQDTSLDLPTIGLKTIEAIHKAGFGGIVVHAQKSLINDQEALVSFANAHHLYVIGIAPETL